MLLTVSKTAVYPGGRPYTSARFASCALGTHSSSTGDATGLESISNGARAQRGESVVESVGWANAYSNRMATRLHLL